MPPTNSKPKKLTPLEAKLTKENNELKFQLNNELSVSRLSTKMNALEYNWIIDQLEIIKETFEDLKPLPEKIKLEVVKEDIN